MRWLICFLCGLCLIIFSSTAYCAEVWEEEFINTNLVDLNKTDAYVYIKPAGGYAELPAKSAAAALELKEDSFDQIIISDDGIEYFMFDGTEMVDNPSLSILFPEGELIEGSSIAIRQDTYSTWVATDKEIFRLDFDGTGMIENPFLKITGKKNILSISSQPYDDKLTALTKTHEGSGLIEYYALTAGVMESLMSFEVDSTFGNPIDIAVVPETMDIIYATDEAVYYYNCLGDSFVQNPFMSVTGLSDIKALTVHDGGYAILRADRKEHYLFTGEEMAHVEALSLNIPNVISIKLRPDEYDFAVLKEDGSTDYYIYDGDEYILNPALSTQVTLDTKRYYTPRRYVSKLNNFTEDFMVFVLDVNEDKPAGTDIKYYIQSGSEEWEISPGAPLLLDEPIQSMTVVAELSTTNENTPRITRIKVSAFNMGIDYIKVDMFPIHNTLATLERPFIIYPEFHPGYSPPIPTQLGSVVVFELKSLGAPETIKIELDLWKNALEPAEKVTLTLNRITDDIWVGTLEVPDDPTGTGIDIDSRYSIEYVELAGDNTIRIPSNGFMYDPFLVIVDETELDILNYIHVYLTK